MTVEVTNSTIAWLTHVETICQQLHIVWRPNQSMRNHTALGVGGQITGIAYPEFPEVAAQLVAELEAKQIPWVALGAGTRLIIQDQPLEKVAISLKLLEELIVFDGTKVKAHGAYRMFRLAAATAQRGLIGLAAFAGRMGTLGAALRAQDKLGRTAIKDLVESVSVVQNGQVVTLTATEFAALAEPKLILGAVLRLSNDAQAQAKWQYKASRSKSLKTTIQGTGPVFAQTKGCNPGKALATAGLSEATFGQAVLASWDNNFIINKGLATSEDVINLIKVITSVVAEKQQLELALALEIW